jgi:hypothetical protein
MGHLAAVQVQAVLIGFADTDPAAERACCLQGVTRTDIAWSRIDGDIEPLSPPVLCRSVDDGGVGYGRRPVTNRRLAASTRHDEEEPGHWENRFHGRGASAPSYRTDANTDHPAKKEVRIYYVDRQVPMLVRMFERRVRGHRSIGYSDGELPFPVPDVDDDYVLGRGWEDTLEDDDGSDFLEGTEDAVD